MPSIAVRVLNRSVLYDRVHHDYLAKPDEAMEEQSVDEELNDILQKAEVLHAEEVPSLQTELDAKTESTDASDDTDNLKALVDEISRKRREAPIVSKIAKSETKELKKEKTKKKETKKKETKKKAPSSKKKSIDSPQINSFTDWLKHKKSIEEKPKEKLKEQTSPLIPIDMAVSHEAELMMEVKKSNLKLEDFLVNQIERKQSKKEQGKGSFKHVVSETYAQILVAQGKIQEAIAIYKELSIKYPKKSSNFARQIENLKNSL